MVEQRDSRIVAVVTGGANGIGAAVAQRLAQDGASVAILDLDAEAAKETASVIAKRTGATLYGVGADVSESSAVDRAIDQVAEEIGPPTILVNNAGITRDNLLFKMTVEDWDSVMSVHLRGTFLVTRAVQRHMVEARWGRIITMSSVAALGNRGQANYSAAKAGLQAFTKTTAIELGGYGVTANAIAPGFIATEMTAKTAERMGISFDEFKRSAAKAIPVGRVGQPEDVAALASFLASEESGFVSGQVIYLAGGPRA
ncbi:3-oxoacyl-ACP reductase FabG [Rhodococcus olei]|uniref:3-oxoacyl-ACP reductase FabG n=1 Tax=Rhodococcus olei TaxID=2161675 RepID=A0ABP8NYB6_9NOCA